MEEGKKTLLIVDSCKNASKDQIKIINLYLGNKRSGTKDLKIVRNIIIQTGALDKSKRESKRLIGKSVRSLNNISLKIEGKEFLLELANYLSNRKY